MIHLERAPIQATRFMRHISEASVGIELPSGDLVPEKLQHHPALKLPYELASEDDPKLSLPGLFVVGGMSSDDIENSILYMSDNIPEEVRPHIGAIQSLIYFGEHPRIIRKILENAYSKDRDLENAIGSALMGITFALEPRFCRVPKEEKLKFLEETGNSIESHQHTIRTEGGEIRFMQEHRSGFRSRISRLGLVESEWLKSEIPFGDTQSDATRMIGNPFVIGIDEKITSAVLNTEPAKPKKPHTCANCHLHIAPKALRVTVSTEGGDKYDHHHYHAGCV